MNDDRFLALGSAVVQTEAAAVAALASRIDRSFAEACRYLLSCEGRIVVIGMGKSGHIGGKIAATLASTGSPAFFVHPGEASHGDLGMITTKDVVLALSNSGETDEISAIVPMIKRLGVPLITLTGNPGSSLAREADVNIDVSVDKEACPLGLAPTSSTTAALVMGDALAVALLEARGFSAEDFARSHPGGRLGRRLLVHVADIMHKGGDIPIVRPDMPLRDALVTMTGKGLGMAVVVDDAGRLLGLVTDGDLRRALDRRLDVHEVLTRDIMTSPCQSVSPSLVAAEALQIMEMRKINGLPVVDENQRVVGAFNMHDLLRAGVL